MKPNWTAEEIVARFRAVTSDKFEVLSVRRLARRRSDGMTLIYNQKVEGEWVVAVALNDDDLQTLLQMENRHEVEIRGC